MKMRSQKIAGHTIKLKVGTQYRASRPMAQVHDTDFPVTITDMDKDIEIFIIDDLTYEDGNKLINKFNNGTISFSGRVW